MWDRVSCLRKQHDDRDWASNHPPSDLKSDVLTTTPSRAPLRSRIPYVYLNLAFNREDTFFLFMGGYCDERLNGNVLV